MEKITAIKQQAKNQQRYSIFVDEKYSFSLSELALINAELKLGQELSKDELAKLKEESDLDKAYNRILNLLARRVRSEWEIRDYLKRKKYDEDAIDKLLNKLSERHLVNDLSFANAWVENRRLLKNMSKRKLTQELRAKRVSDEIIDEVMGLDETNELEVLRELVERKKSRYPDKTKFMRYLAGQGFNYNDIKTVLADKGN
ncbi:MAG TPA: RecX family transcriptional regulator [Candidatus Saccharimonadales bacterium]|nr:RecX family transcriptional regulator [Candidatus Saccharimonadales bacterium]